MKKQQNSASMLKSVYLSGEGTLFVNDKEVQDSTALNIKVDEVQDYTLIIAKKNGNTLKNLYSKYANMRGAFTARIRSSRDILSYDQAKLGKVVCEIREDIARIIVKADVEIGSDLSSFNDLEEHIPLPMDESRVLTLTDNHIKVMISEYCARRSERLIFPAHEQVVYEIEDMNVSLILTTNHSKEDTLIIPYTIEENLLGKGVIPILYQGVKPSCVGESALSLINEYVDKMLAGLSVGLSTNQGEGTVGYWVDGVESVIDKILWDNKRNLPTEIGALKSKLDKAYEVLPNLYLMFVKFDNVPKKLVFAEFKRVSKHLFQVADNVTVEESEMPDWLTS